MYPVLGSTDSESQRMIPRMTLHDSRVEERERKMNPDVLVQIIEPCTGFLPVELIGSYSPISEVTSSIVCTEYEETASSWALSLGSFTAYTLDDHIFARALKVY